MRGRAALALALAATLAVRSVEAQSNYRSTPIGGRTTLMGSTGLNYGIDGAAPFQNPATLVLVDDERLSFSVNFYTFTAFRAPRWYQPAAVDSARFGAFDDPSASLTDLEFNALPSSLCLFLSSSRTSRLALCAAATQTSSFTFASERQDVGLGLGRLTRIQQTMLVSFIRFALGPTYAVQISERLTIGASLFGGLAMHRSSINANAQTYGGPAPPISSSFYSGSRGDTLELHALAGLTYRVGKHSFALALEAPSLHVFGVGAANLNTHFEGAGASTRSVGVDGSFVSSTPFRVGVGTGVAGEKGSAELNLFFHAPMGRAYEANLEGTSVTIDGAGAREEKMNVVIARGARAVLNAGIGGQYLLTPTLSVLGGFSTDFSAAPADEPRGDLLNYNTARTHRLSGTIGFGSHAADPKEGELVIGTELSYGWGKRLVVNSYQLPPEFSRASHGTFTALLIIAGSTSLASIRRAVSDAAGVWRNR
ncbi:MAG: hypothetical protein HYV09_31530 [Deltaproteobacteria bacterium]|nr:hypothetical protein [Deltaproteobacteria bacterium]